MNVKHKGFTLIELLVVIAIIVILAAILFPVFAQAREKARATACLSNCKQTGLAFYMYTEDYDEQTPAINKNPSVIGLDGTAVYPPWYYLLMPYVKDWHLFTCPDDNRTFPLGLTNATESDKGPSGNDPYDCFDDLNPTGLCISYGYNDGFVTDGGYGLIQEQNLTGTTVRLGRQIGEIVSPASTVAFGDADTKHDGSIACDAALKWAVPYGSKSGKGLTTSSQLRHDMLENFVFCDGHAHAIRMLVATNSNYNLTTNGGNPLYLPVNPADALDWCYDPNAVSTYAGYAPGGGYPLVVTGLTCSQAVANVYANSVTH